MRHLSWPKVVQVVVYIYYFLPSDCQICLGLLPESVQFLLDLVIDFDSFAFVLPSGELRLMELLLKFGLHLH